MSGETVASRDDIVSLIRSRDVHVVFQPIVDIHSKQTVAFEALARWESPELGNVPPGDFIATAERVGMVNRLTLPLLSKALNAATRWPKGIRLAFNLYQGEFHRAVRKGDEALLQLVEDGFARITPEQYEAMPQVCVICGGTERLRVDHSHRTGRVRGLLCDPCNKGLGFFRDDPTLLLRASDYLLGVAKPDIFEATYEPVESDG